MVTKQYNAIYRFVKVVFILSLLFASLLIIGLIVPWQNSCKPVQYDPDLNVSRSLQNVASHDYTAIAKLHGYINYPHDTDYLPVYLTKVKYTSKPSQFGGDYVELTLGSQCSEVVIRIYVNDEVQIVRKISIRRIYMHEDDLECFIEGLNFSSNPKYYYSCANFSMKCHNKLSHQEAIVHMDVLEFEINGKPDEIKKGLFSKSESIYCNSLSKRVQIN